MGPGGQAAGQPDMAVENPSNRVPDGVVDVVGLDQHGVEAGHAAGLRLAGPLEQLGQHGEHTGRVALGGRRLVGGQANLPLGHGQAGHRVHQQQHVLAAVAEVLGHCGGHEAGPHPQHRRFIRGADHHHRLAAALWPQVLLQELANFAAALANQGPHHHVRIGVAGDHAHEHALAHPGAGEQAHALAAAGGGHGVDGPDAGGDRLTDPGAIQGPRGGAIQRVVCLAIHSRAAVDHPPHAVEHPAEQFVAHPHPSLARLGQHLVAAGDALGVAKWHEQGAVVPETHHLGLDQPARLQQDPAHGPDGRGQATDHDGQTGHVADPPDQGRRANLCDSLQLSGKRALCARLVHTVRDHVRGEM